MRTPAQRSLGATLALGLVAAFALSGCAQDKSDLEHYVAEINDRPGSGIDPIPTLEPHEPFLYPGHSRSPFDSTVIAQPELAAAEGEPGDAEIDPDRPREFLESFPLDSLRMVGSLQQDGVRYALVRTPDRGIQRVTVGNYIGQNHGRIVEITQTQVKLVEVVPDAFGGYVERENSVALAD